MKTLVFCTAFASNQDVWDSRYRRWVEALRASRLRFDQALIVDDGSEVVPDWPHLAIVSERDFGEAERLVSHDPLVFYHFEEHLGRKDIRDFPGWYRSFSFAARYAEAQGFGKVIHIESDAYLISPRIVDYVNHLSDGWTVFWCPSYDFPEIAIQIIAGDEVANLARFFRRPYDDLAGVTHELVLPYTRVVRNFIGDRYGERTDVPRHADYATQVGGDDEEEYYWWLRSPELPEGADAADGAAQADGNPDNDADAGEILIEFGIDGNSEQYVGDGWSDPEGEWRWMIGAESELVLPAFTEEIDNVLVMRVAPCVHDELMPRQRLGIELNDTSIADLELESDTEIAVELPRAAMNRTQLNYIRFIHPDAVSPASMLQGADDRPLAIAVEQALVRRSFLESGSQSAELEPAGQISSPREATPVQVLAHIRQVGDVWFRSGKWAGCRDSGLWIEGVVISSGPKLPAGEIEYSAVLPDGTFSDWIQGGEFCGSRGQNAPFFGIRVRLRGASVKMSRCFLFATFTDGSKVGLIEGDDVTCRAESSAPLEAFWLDVRPLTDAAGASREKSPEPVIDQDRAPVPKADQPSPLAFPSLLLSASTDNPSLPYATWKIREESLDAIGVKHGTDKASNGHGYLGFYARFFEGLRNQRISLLEIGVGTGQSLRMWQEYFPAARIVGVDVDPGTVQYSGGRISIEVGDQSEITDLTRIARKHGPFDIVVDDGSHFWNAQITTFQILYAFVRDGGFYALEDLHTSYGDFVSEYQGSSDISAAKYLQRFGEFLVGGRELDRAEQADAFIGSYAGRTEFIAFHRGTAVLKRKL